ncbi:leucine-rich repeat-containing [Chlorella sorokiniana]|uniref:Leucine-rich repeat-containing n=1 Tax=Chlorella sorokiniana TaxID=3076 RepID=A0A2P6U2R7_CHLSO|nr:leucine-rich repeat-containing [Chlorella sorokiniana]|eukprot:PRW60600.1 leucine-rich repeat-containing [Chlorella sorokiniana]
MGQAEAESEEAAAADLPPSEPPPPWAELPAPALDATRAALSLQDRLSASAACKTWLEVSSASATLWGTLSLDEDSGVGGNGKPSAGLTGLLKTPKSGDAAQAPPPQPAEPQPEGTVAWFKRRAGAIHSFSFSTWDEQCAKRLAGLVPLALRGLAAEGGTAPGTSAGSGGIHAGARAGLRELEISLEGSMPLDECSDVLAGCGSLRRLTLTTASTEVMAALPTSLTGLKLSLAVPFIGTASPEEYLQNLVAAATPLGRLSNLRQLEFQSDARVMGALPVSFAPPQLTQLSVRQPSLCMLPPQISSLSRLEKLDLIAEISLCSEEDGGGGADGEEEEAEEGEEGEEEEEGDGGGPRFRIYRFVLVEELDTLSRLRSLRFYNCWFDEMPEVITALGSLEELAIKNSRLSAFPDQHIDMAGGLLRGRDFSFLPACLSALAALQQLAVEVTPSSTMGLMFGTSRPLEFAPQLSRLTTLETVEFYGCCLRELPAAIAGMKGLWRVVVADGAIAASPSFLVAQPAALDLHIPEGLLLGLEQLKDVQLRGCSFQESHATVHVPPSVKRVYVTGASKLQGVDFGPRATG